MNFEEVYERFKNPIWRLARRLCDTDDEALEASQEIFLRVWRGLGGFRGEAKLSTWVFQVAWNYLRGARRRKGRQPFFVGGDHEDGESIINKVQDQAATPEDRAQDRDRLERVMTAVHGLPEHYRIVLWLRDGEDLSYEEIARVLDMPIGTVRSRLARARMQLKTAVESR